MDALFYTSIPMRKRYLELNGFTFAEVDKNTMHDDHKAWIVWEMVNDHIGIPAKSFKLKRDAVAYCAKLNAAIVEALKS